MRGLIEHARRFYASALGPGEKIAAAHLAYASRTGTLIASGVVLGAFVGWLIAGSIESAPLPASVLGSCVGLIGGYVAALRWARLGPGDIQVVAVLTTERLLLFRRNPRFRSKLLRAITLESVEAVSTERLPIGNYHRQAITTTAGLTISLIVDGWFAIDPVNTDTPTR